MTRGPFVYQVNYKLQNHCLTNTCNTVHILQGEEQEEGKGIQYNIQLELHKLGFLQDKNIKKLACINIRNLFSIERYASHTNHLRPFLEA